MKGKLLPVLSALLLTACSESNNIPDDVSLPMLTSEITVMTDEETIPEISFRSETSLSEASLSETMASENSVESRITETEPEISETIATEPTPELTEHICYADEEHVKISGRTIFDNNIRYLGYTCSSVEFTFRGTYAEFELIPEPQESEEDEYSYYSVWVDSEELYRGLLEEERVFCAVDETIMADHTVKIIKLSEGCFGAVGIGQIKTISFNEITPTPAADHRIEFIGDSLTCGYGNEASHAEEHFRTSTENGLAGYASLTAQRLGFDYNIIGMNGIGIVSRYTPHGEKRTEGLLMPELYKYTDGFRNDELWDNSRFLPDICVIALGANDNSYTLGIKSREEEFAAGYIGFIKQVRADNPDAYILCVSGIQRSNLYDVISDAAADYISETNDKRISTFCFESQKASEGYGADYHPSMASQKRFSEELYDEIIRLFPEYSAE